MDVCTGSSFHTTITNTGKFDVHLTKHQKAGKLADAPIFIVHIRDNRYSHLSGA